MLNLLAKATGFFYIAGAELIVLLCGGDKSTQQKDIKKAKQLAKDL